MATAKAPDTEGDVIRRGIKRTLPCKLTDDEFMQIAKTRVDKEALLLQLESDLAKEKKKRQDQIAELSDEIAKMGRELHTGEQDRTVECVDVFVRAEDGTGWVHTIRKTGEDVERRPASPAETQRHLPGVEGVSVGGAAAPLLDQAIAAQGGDLGEADVDPDDEEAEDPEDDGLTELTPAQKAAKESASARKARRGGKGKAKS